MITTYVLAVGFKKRNFEFYFVKARDKINSSVGPSIYIKLEVASRFIVTKTKTCLHMGRTKWKLIGYHFKELGFDYNSKRQQFLTDSSS